MNYKKKYQEALDKARDMLKYKEVRQEDMEYLFPELHKSEDEKLRKATISFLKEFADKGYENAVECIDWLEKQGISYTKRDVDDAYLEGMAFAKNELEKQNKQILANLAKTCKDKQEPADEVKAVSYSHITPNPEFFQWIYDRLKYVYNENPNIDYMRSLRERIKDMQESAWSEEDKDYYDAIIAKLEVTQDDATLTDNQMKFLKSLKDRVGCEANCTTTKEWKPTKEQIAALDEVYKTHGANSACRRVLITLLNDLKKLREE